MRPGQLTNPPAGPTRGASACAARALRRGEGPARLEACQSPAAASPACTGRPPAAKPDAWSVGCLALACPSPPTASTSRALRRVRTPRAAPGAEPMATGTWRAMPERAASLTIRHGALRAIEAARNMGWRDTLFAYRGFSHGAMRSPTEKVEARLSTAALGELRGRDVGREWSAKRGAACYCSPAPSAQWMAWRRSSLAFLRPSFSLICSRWLSIVFTLR